MSVISGGATQDQFKALVLAAPHPRPRARLLGRHGGDEKVLLRRAPASDALRAQLSARSMDAYALLAYRLQPGASYAIRIRAGAGREQVVRLTTLPRRLPDSGLTVAVGSCYYDGYHRDAKLLRALRQKRIGKPASLQLWAGDNLYLDVPFFSQDTAAHAQTVERYLSYFLRSGYRYVRAHTPCYTTYDDHDFWNNYPEDSLWLSRDDFDQRERYVAAARDCLELFQASLNPPRVSAEGLSCQFEIPPLQFFVADVRAKRQRRTSAASCMMDSEDLKRLELWVRTLKGPGVLVLGQPLWIGAGSSFADYNPPAYADYKRIWAALREAPYDILVVSGDVHHSRVLRLSTGNGTPRNVYEFVSSPACHIPTVLSTVLPGLNQQGSGDIDLPTRDPGTGQAVRAKYIFGTSAPNSVGLLHFRPIGRDNVAVGGGFVDYGGNMPVWAKAEPCKTGLPAADFGGMRCRSERLFVLRDRAEYV